MWHYDVEVESQGKEVGKFHDAERGEAAAEAHESANVGEEIHEAVELPSLLPHEVEALEVYVDDSKVVFNVVVIQVLWVGFCKAREESNSLHVLLKKL